MSADAGEEKKAAAVEFMAVGTGQQMWVDTLQDFPIPVTVGDRETQLGKDSVKLVTDALAASEFPRKLNTPGKDSLENDLGVVLPKIAGGLSPSGGT